MAESPRAAFPDASWYQDVVRSATDYAVISMDPAGFVVAWSPGATKLFQYTEAETRGQFASLIFTPEDIRHGVPERERAAALEHGSSMDERWHVRKDGSQVWASGRLIRVSYSNGAIRGFAKIVQDRTLEKAVQDALRQSEERYRLVSRATNDVIWDWDLNTNEIVWNDAALTHFGLSPDEFATSIDAWKARLHPDDRERVTQELEVAISSGAAGWSGRYKFLCKRGYETFFDRGAIARDEYGHAIRIIGSMLNLTNDRRAEHSLHEAQERIARQNAELEERVAQRTRELTGAINHLEEFSYSMSHDLKGPAHTIRALVEILRDEQPGPEEITDLLQRLHRNAFTLCELINEMVNFSAIGLSTPKIEPVDLDELVRRVVTELQERKPNAANHIDVLGTLGVAWADGTLLGHATRNLISNALKFVAPGVSPKVLVSVERMGDRVRLHVQDNGIGIEPRFRDQIFELFRRLHHPRVYPGYGAGLATVKRAVEKIGGTVSFESVVAKGTVFTVELPAPPPNGKRPMDAA